MTDYNRMIPDNTLLSQMNDKLGRIIDLLQNKPEFEEVDFNELAKLQQIVAEAKPMKDLKQIDLVDVVGDKPTISASRKVVGKKKKAKKKIAKK